MDTKSLTRRQFIAGASVSSLATVTPRSTHAGGMLSKKSGKLAILGGEPVRKNRTWPKWPYWDDNVLDAVAKTTKSAAISTVRLVRVSAPLTITLPSWR